MQSLQICKRCKICKILENQTYQAKPTKPNLPNLPNQTYQTKSKHTEIGIPNQNYWSKQSTPGSVVPLAMFYLLSHFYLAIRRVRHKTKCEVSKRNLQRTFTSHLQFLVMNVHKLLLFVYITLFAIKRI